MIKKMDMPRMLVLITIIFSIVLPIFFLKYIHPNFKEIVIFNTTKNAIRLGNHMASHDEIVNYIINQDNKDYIDEFVKTHIEHFKLYKIKIFDHLGNVIYSTQEKDYGSKNENKYFTDIVAKGKTYTKVVKKMNKSLEGEEIPIDVVEDYIPIINQMKFLGAFEIYKDITYEMNLMDQFSIKVEIAGIILILLFMLTIAFLYFKHCKNERIEKEHHENLLKLEKVNAINAMVVTYNHEIRNPLTEIKCSSLLLSKQNNDQKNVDILKNIMRSLKKAISIVESIEKLSNKSDINFKNYTGKVDMVSIDETKNYE